MTTDPYEGLLQDARRGDSHLFAREDEIEAQWRVVNPVLGEVVPVQAYDPGSVGPPKRTGWHRSAAAILFATAQSSFTRKEPG